MYDPNFIGQNGFFWFIGCVEDRKDPLLLGRVRVRALGWHTENKAEIPTEDLPWATVMMPATTPSSSGVGAISGLVEGSWVFGFFMDGIDAQEPTVMGSYHGIPRKANDQAKGFNDPGKTLTERPVPGTAFPRSLGTPDTPAVSRGAVLAKPTISMHQGLLTAAAGPYPTNSVGHPGNPAAPLYPYNRAITTESGHVIELDDTKGSERIHVYHRSGSYIEMLPNGTVIIHAVNDQQHHTNGNSFDHTSINKDMIAGSKFTIKGATIVVESTADTAIKVGSNASVQVAGNATVSVSGNVTQSVGGNYTLTVGGSMTQVASGPVTIIGSTVNINP